MSFGFEVHHILPRALFNDPDINNQLGEILNTGNKSFLDYHSNHINLFDNDDMANIMKTFSHEQASVGWVLAPTRLDMTNNTPIFQAA